jgi:hypothetical protein
MYQAYSAAIVPLAGMEMRGTRRRSFWRAFCSLFHFAFPDPDLTDPFDLTVRRPPHTPNVP